ncbi:MAG: ribonuclease HI family protein [Leptospiraceae bacterium]|nr:ribonuclease HI family protein [Leptospiraceae bacterium]
MKLIAYTDGACRGNPGESAIGVIVFDGEDLQKPVLQLSESIGVMTNNQAEYISLIKLLENTANMQYSSMTIKMDSKLVVEQMNGRYKVKNKNLLPLFTKAVKLFNAKKIQLVHIPRELNTQADALANAALDRLQ